MSKPKAYVNEKKIIAVKNLSADIEKYKIIGLVDMENLPAPQLQKMKQSLRGKVEIRMTKKNLIKYALMNSKRDLSGLTEKIRGMPALLLTNENPFKLYKIVSASKSAAPAKAGQRAPRDIIIPAGKTPFAPGPVIGELGQLGIKTGIEDGKIVIKQDKLVANEGDVLNLKLCGLLTRLNIQPMEIGLNIVAVYENGVIFDRKVLDIDEKVYISNLKQLHNEAMNLAVKIKYTTKDTIKVMIQKAHREAEAVKDKAHTE
ncbi:50S ribosomal protein L10 [Candidatus Pacearchaeota archaeon]|nr:50S ribosomal protein L10 [Candidatus Pacearchaeota archaeon]